MNSLDRILPFLQPIAHLLDDPTITEVMVNAGGRFCFIERDGALLPVPGCTVGGEMLKVAIKQIARWCGQEVSEDHPILDARLEDGSRVAACFPPRSVDGATLTIRRFGRRFSIEQLVEVGMLTGDEAFRLADAIAARDTILISGGTGTGKTTLLNALAALIPPADRIVLLEDTSEIHVTKPNLVRLEAGRPETVGSGDQPRPAISLSDLLRLALRLRPDRIILGEVRGPEAFDLLQALNTGHRGSLSTIHANSAAQSLTRLRHLVLSRGAGMPDDSVREAIADAIQIVVHIDRVGPRRIVRDIVETSARDSRPLALVSGG